MDDITKEGRAYLAHKEELLKKHKGKYVLVKNEKIQGIFDTQEEAYDCGYKKFGHVSYWIQEIVEVEEVIDFSRYSLEYLGLEK